MLMGTMRLMKQVWLISVILLSCSHPCCAIYGPSLARADASVALRACQEANFAQGQEITKALQSGNSAQVLGVLGDALREWRATPSASTLYTGRAFCIHELVPSHLPPSLDHTKTLSPTPEVRRFQDLGVTYFFYDPTLNGSCAIIPSISINSPLNIWILLGAAKPS
jgi:hypothetical protein